jgi:hypothetical protein
LGNATGGSIGLAITYGLLLLAVIGFTVYRSRRSSARQ